MAYEITDGTGKGTYTTYGWRIPLGGHAIGAAAPKSVTVEPPYSSTRYVYALPSSGSRSVSLTFRKVFADADAMYAGVMALMAFIETWTASTLNDNLAGVTMTGIADVEAECDTSESPAANVSVTFTCDPALEDYDG